LLYFSGYWLSGRPPLILAAFNDILAYMPKRKTDFGLNLEEMAKAGLHFGHNTSKLHPKMKPYVFGIKNTIHLIDLEKSRESLVKALTFVRKLAEEKRTILLVGTRIEHKELVKKTAEELSLPYVNQRWLGGTLTNFEVIKKRIVYLQKLEDKKESDEFGKYTKKERGEIEKELSRLREKFDGIRGLEKPPDAVFVCSVKKDALAVKEARGKNIFVIGIADTDVDPRLVDYPILANDDALVSVEYVLNKLAETIKKVKS
jgi:small subunit ribosomal protein S2